MAYKKEKREQQEIAEERIIRLLELAGAEAMSGDREAASRHVKLARAVGMRYNVRLPREFRGRYCKACSSYFTPENSKRRMNSKEKRLEVACGKCGRVMKFRYG